MRLFADLYTSSPFDSIWRTAKGESFSEKVAARQVYGTVLTKKEQKGMREVCRVRSKIPITPPSSLL